MRLGPYPRIARRVLGALGVAPPPALPTTVNWQLTYACPLRCEHCYSESGRRSVRQLPLDSLLRIAERLLEMRPLPTFTFTGGEPTLVPGFLELARRLRAAGAAVLLYTSGYKLERALLDEASRVFSIVAVSIDGADAEVNDALRGRAGAFDEAVRTLTLLDDLSRTDARGRAAFGIEYSVMRSNWHQLARVCTEVATPLEHLAFVHFGAVVPAGLASRTSFARKELLDEEQMKALPALEKELSRHVRAGVRVRASTNLPFMMHPEQLRHGQSCDIILEIEADGGVRAMSMYEGVVGNLLEEPFDVLWQRTLERQRDPFVTRELGRVRSMPEWSAAARAIDRRFTAADDHARFDGRPELPGAPEEATRPRRELRVLWP